MDLRVYSVQPVLLYKRANRLALDEERVGCSFSPLALVILTRELRYSILLSMSTSLREVLEERPSGAMTWSVRTFLSTSENIRKFTSFSVSGLRIKGNDNSFIAFRFIWLGPNSSHISRKSEESCVGIRQTTSCLLPEWLMRMLPREKPSWGMRHRPSSFVKNSRWPLISSSIYARERKTIIDEQIQIKVAYLYLAAR